MDSASKELFGQELLGHTDLLYRVAMRLSRNAADAEDLVQETVVRALRFSDHYEQGTHLRAWLVRMMTNLFINSYRRKQRLDGVTAEDSNSVMAGGHSVREASGDESQMGRGLLLEKVRAAVDRLPDDYRIVLVLSDVEELSYREIADAVGCPMGTVMSRLHRARKQVQQAVEQEVQPGQVIQLFGGGRAR